MQNEHEKFMKLAIQLSKSGMETGKGGPFGCVVVKDGKILGQGCNEVLLKNDPTAHAEVVAIREACRTLGDFQLTGCVVYTSCEPCPMCMGAIYWARPERVIYANTKSDAAAVGFDDQFIYQELDLPGERRAIPFSQMMREEAYEVFQSWRDSNNKTLY